MPPIFLIKLASAIVGNRLAKAAAWALIVVAAIALLLIAKAAYDRDLIADHDAAVTEKTLRTDAAAKDEAADQRARDTIAIDTAEKERQDAIQNGQAGRPDAARNRLNCDRLRRAGIATSDFAECR